LAELCRVFVFIAAVCTAISVGTPAHAVPSSAKVPPGITTYERGDGNGFADAKGLALYTVGSGQAQLCRDECTKTWTPFIAADGAAAVGEWSLVPRDNGTKQWAYQGRALFTYAFDAPGSVNGDGYLANTGVAAIGNVWRPVYHLMAMPPGMTVVAAQAEAWRVLANADGFTFYTSQNDAGGRSACVARCLETWKPVAAPLLARPSGPWSVITRDDGSRQWAYRGKPLYTYAHDIKPGDTLGEGIDKAWHAAAIVKAPEPPAGITVQYSERYSDLGRVFADSNGMTLYAYYENPARLPVICDTACMRTYWRPALVASGAIAHGPWSATTLGDGSRQWVYQGKALYTFAKDRLPGDMRGEKFGYPGDQAGSWGVIPVRPPS
jgi:predicted lipoprotein with Yx(FWY)xxD motif